MFDSALKCLQQISAVLFLVSNIASHSPPLKVCKTKDCLKTSNDIRAAMDANVDPCEDFYQFVCGRFLEEKDLKDDKVTACTSDDLEDTIDQEILESLTKKLPKNTQTRPFKMAQTLYKQCMDQNEIDKLGLEKARMWYKRFGGWPVLEGDVWDEHGFDWLNATLDMYKNGFGSDSIIDVSVYPCPKNTTRRIIEIDQADLGVDLEFLKHGLKMKIVQAYYKFMVDAAVLYGAKRETAEAEFRESLEFEIQLAGIAIPIHEMRNQTNMYNPRTLAQLQKEMPFIQWEHFLRQLIPEYVDFPRPDERVNVVFPLYLSQLGDLLNSTPKRVIANYMMWKCAMENTNFLTSDMIEASLNFVHVMMGLEKRPERWKECTSRLTELMDVVVNAMYVRQHTSPKLKPLAMDMVVRIHKEMIKMLSKTKWMDDKTRKRAIDKANAIVFHVGYPDELLDNQKLDKLYENVTLDSNLFDSVNKIMKVMNPSDFAKLNEAYNKTDWTEHCNSIAVNAFYHPSENSIEMPAGILRLPFFSADRPSYLNYGAIGYVIAHEMVHAFDDEGRQYDEDGNLCDWWEEKTGNLYLEKAKEIVDEYSNFTVREINMTLKGNNTQGENIADHAGIKIAYEAYLHLTSQQKEEPHLPNFQNYTPRQMFWVSAGHSWCTKYRPNYLKMYVTTGHHPSAEYRINGPFRYTKYFATDFKCPVGSFMNPKVKPNVW